MIKATYALMGEGLPTKSDEAVADKIMKVECSTLWVQGCKINREALNTDGTLNYTKLITYLTENAARNQLIADSIEQRPSLILSDRLNHLEELISLQRQEEIPLCHLLTGKGRTGRTTVGASVPHYPTEGLRCGDTEYRAYRSYL